MKRFLFLTVLALAVLACTSITAAPKVFQRSILEETPLVPVTGAEGFEGCGAAVVDVQNAQFEQEVVEQTNEIRMEAGMPPLKRVETLDTAARYHAADMSVENYFSHDTYNLEDERLSMRCQVWNRLESYYTNWQALGENIAAGQRGPALAMEGWMNSPDHKHNILSPNFYEIGVGFVEGGGDYRFYWVQDFGRTNGRYPLIIEGEKAVTSSPEVQVYIYGDQWQAMRLRADDGEWSQWIDFKNDFTWTLPEMPGEHTLTAELRGEGETITTEDAITLEVGSAR